MNQDVLVQSHASVRKFGIVIFDSPFFLNGGQFIYIGHLLWFKDFFGFLSPLYSAAFLLCFSALLLLCCFASPLCSFPVFFVLRFFICFSAFLLLCFSASLFFVSLFFVLCFVLFLLAFLASCFSSCFLVILLDYKCSYNYMKNSTSSTNNKSSMYARNNENNKSNKRNKNNYNGKGGTQSKLSLCSLGGAPPPAVSIVLLRAFVFALFGFFALV